MSKKVRLTELPSGDWATYTPEGKLRDEIEPDSVMACVSKMNERSKSGKSVKLSESDQMMATMVDRASMGEVEMWTPSQAQGALSSKVRSLQQRHGISYAEALGRFCTSQKGQVLYGRCAAAATEPEGE